MKIRHVRAIAVFGIAIVALTGARGSHGGSCGGGSSHSSGSRHDNDTTTSGGSTGSLSGGSSSSSGYRAERDVKIDKCGLDASGKNLTAKITVTNNDSLTYDYDVSLQFKGDLGDTKVNLAIAKVEDLKVAPGASAAGNASTAYTGSGDGSEYKKCEVISATRTAS
ncbi:hypothetical protein [Streptomyces sp. NPDC005408]|uniref:hypothetical protein n=1 Tax=Streptomyces sp. NPDC005408 TaxID=3155341 RepID=UPI0033B6E789